MDQKTSRQGNQKKSLNIWKWAFFALVAVLLIGAGTLASKIFAQPAVTTSQTQPTNSAANFNVTLNKKQLNAMAAYYLDQFQTESKQKVTYQFEVHKDAVLTGETKLLGLSVNFGLSFTPKVLPNGNVQLTAKKLAIGQLSVPVKAVMSYIKSQYNLPKWVELNVKNKTVTMNLHKFRTNGVQYRAQKINLDGDGHFEFKVLVPKAK